MNPTKLISILRGDPIEDWLDRQQLKLEEWGLDWLPKVAMAILALVIVGTILGIR